MLKNGRYGQKESKTVKNGEKWSKMDKNCQKLLKKNNKIKHRKTVIFFFKKDQTLSETKKWSKIL